MVEDGHLPVMPQEVLDFLAPRPGGAYLDGTVGGGGHARLILEASSPDGLLIGLDRDPTALAAAARRLSPFGERALLRRGNFADAGQILRELEVAEVDGVLLDLGVSSMQLDTPERGFSWRAEAPLDMRMDPDLEESAADVVNGYPEQELARIFREYGEERFARRIARKIVRTREETPIRTTHQLADLVRATVPGDLAHGRIHAATRVFQALRIQVNGELDHVAAGVRSAVGLLRPGGRLVVISFHSLEDRIVKSLFREESAHCVCPPQLPLCRCGQTPRLRLLTRRAVRASAGEVQENPRARSAVLRAAERLDDAEAQAPA